MKPIFFGDIYKSDGYKRLQLLAKELGEGIKQALIKRLEIDKKWDAKPD